MSPAFFPAISKGRRSSKRGVASSARPRRLVVVALSPIVFSACNGILGIGEPKDPPEDARGGGGNAGSRNEQGGEGGEGGDGRGGSGASRAGGTGGMRATGGTGGGIQGGESGTGVAGARPEGGESGAGEAGIGGTAGAGDAGAGGGDPTGGCDPDGDFDEHLVRLPINDDVPRIFLARLTDDELTMVFQDIGLDIWIADRASTTEDFRDPRRMAELNTDIDEWAPTITGDGFTLFFQRNANIFAATRERRSDFFSEPFQVVSLDGTRGPYVVPNGQAMYLHGDGNANSVFRAERSRAGSFAFGPRSELSELGVRGIPWLPVVSADELTIYFASDRSGGIGRNDIYRARRSSREDRFGEPKHVSELNSGQDEIPDWISRDHCTLYMHRWVPSVGGEEIFMARRPQ